MELKTRKKSGKSTTWTKKEEKNNRKGRKVPRKDREKRERVLKPPFRMRHPQDFV
jgi:hypothetical protein